MAEGAAAMDEWIATLEGLGDLVEDAAPDVARAVEAELRDQVGRGVDPQGKPWPKTKAGKRALPDAMDDVTVRARGRRIEIKVTGAHARHHLGAVRGGVRRQIIPEGKLPRPMADAIGRVLEERFAEKVGR